MNNRIESSIGYKLSYKLGNLLAYVLVLVVLILLLLSPYLFVLALNVLFNHSIPLNSDTYLSVLSLIFCWNVFTNVLPVLLICRYSSKSKKCCSTS